MLQTGRELAVCVLVLLTIGTVTNTSSEATDGSDSVAERWSECEGHSDSGSRSGVWTCILVLSGEPARECLDIYNAPATHAVLWQLVSMVICIACLFKTSSYETLVYKASQRAFRTVSAKLRALYNLGASLIGWVANPFSGGPHWCHVPSGFAEWVVFIYAIFTVWCIMAGFWLYLRETPACSFEHIKGLPGVHKQGAAASGTGQEPSPAASSDSTSGEDGSSTLETQASGESPGSGNRTSSAAGVDETMPTGKGDAAGVLVSSGKAKAKKGKGSTKTMAGGKQGPATLAAAGGANSNKAHHSIQADPSSSEPHLDNAVAGPPVPAAHAAPAPAVVHSLPVDVGDVAGGRVLTAREQRLKEKKREKKSVNRGKAAAARKAAADLAAAGNITASSADHPGQAGASNPAEPAVPAAPAEPAVPAAPHSSTSLQWFSSGHLADV